MTTTDGGRGTFTPKSARSVRLQDQHTIAVGEETVLLAHSLVIGGANEFAVGERGDEHEQGRPGEVEIGEQGADDLELERRVDEHLRRAFTLCQRQSLTGT